MNKVYKYNKWNILWIILLGPFMATLDSSIVNVALPLMAQKLSVGIDEIQWIVSSYLIVIAATILIFGKLADIFGKSRIFQYGFLTFSIGSLFCGISNTLNFLILSRIVQALGSSMMMSSNQALITEIFDSSDRGKALGFSGTAVALGTMVGPPLGGILLGFFRWESIFLINIPIGIIAFWLSIKMFPKNLYIKEKLKFDIVGSILFGTSITLLFWAILSGEKAGWNSIKIIISFIFSVVLMVLFILKEKKADNPLIDLNIFKNNIFTVGIITAFISYMAIFYTNIIHPFYLQYVLKMVPAEAGMFLMIYPITVSIVAPFSGYLSDKTSKELLTFLGLVLTTLGLIKLAFLKQTSSYTNVIFSMSILGFGNGLFQSPNNTLVMSSVPNNKLGIGGSINALTRNLGMIVGISTSITILNNRISYKLGYKVTKIIQGQESSFIYAMNFTYIIGAIFACFGIIITVWRMYSEIAYKKRTS